MTLSFTFVAVTAGFFVVVAAAFLWEGLRAPTRRVRNLALLAAGLSVQFAAGAAWAAGGEAGELGWISGGTERFIFDWLGLAVEIIALGLGVAAVVVVSRADTALHQAARMTAILSRRVAHVGPLDDLRLTAREVQVLELLSSGVRSDRELSEHLSISAATAATHVRNIMTKAGVNRRQDLLLLGHADGE